MYSDKLVGRTEIQPGGQGLPFLMESPSKMINFGAGGDFRSSLTFILPSMGEETEAHN